MKCTSPRYAYLGNDKKIVFVSKTFAMANAYCFPITCGKCEACWQAKRCKLAELVTAEAQGRQAYLITTTINNNNYNANNWRELMKHWSDCVKSLKKTFKWSARDCKYLAVSELGDRTGRIHGHAVLLLRHAKDPRGLKRWLEARWRWGYVDVRAVPRQETERVVRYITKYITKDKDNQNAYSKGMGTDYIKRNSNGKVGSLEFLQYWRNGKITMKPRHLRPTGIDTEPLIRQQHKQIIWEQEAITQKKYKFNNL